MGKQKRPPARAPEAVAPERVVATGLEQELGNAAAVAQLPEGTFGESRALALDLVDRAALALEWAAPDSARTARLEQILERSALPTRSALMDRVRADAATANRISGIVAAVAGKDGTDERGSLTDTLEELRGGLLRAEERTLSGREPLDRASELVEEVSTSSLADLCRTLFLQVRFQEEEEEDEDWGLALEEG